jgi:hypothetical protein
MTTKIEFTPEKAKQLQKYYLYALKEKKITFFFEGNEYVTHYAKYLIEHLKNNKLL